MARKPKVFVNEINKTIKNNREIFDTTKNLFDNKILEEVKEKLDNSTVFDKITGLLNRQGYIFNVDVVIVTKDNTYNTHIASVVNNHIITLDNDIISIDDILDIKY